MRRTARPELRHRTLHNAAQRSHDGLTGIAASAHPPPVSAAAVYSRSVRTSTRASFPSVAAAAATSESSLPPPPPSPPPSPSSAASSSASAYASSVPPRVVIHAPDEGDWEARYKALKAERQAAAIARWEELQEQFPDVEFPSPDGSLRPDKKVIRVLNKLFNLTLLESYQLRRLMDQAYGYEDGAGGGGGGAEAAAAAGGGGGGSAAAADTKAAPAAAPAADKSSFSVRLDSFAPADKIKIIKEVRAASGLGLKESKELVEAAPKLIKKDLSKADCDALVAKLKEAGAKVTVE